MKFEVVVKSNGGDATTKAKALVLALKGEVQYWYANIPKGHITSWFFSCETSCCPVSRACKSKS
jgi:hypothetical protein